MKRLTKENTVKERHAAGVYRIFNKLRRLEYVGSSKDCKHRISSYHQKDDFSVNKTKKALRPHAVFYLVEYCNIDKARRLEKEYKKIAPHNVSNPGKRATHG